MKLLLASDLHFRDSYPHGDAFSDARLRERQDIEDAIIEASKSCDAVLLNGDNFDVRNPSSSVVRRFTEFLERFGNKRVFINVGNHSNTADGRCAEDYLKELTGKNWEVINGRVHKEDGLCIVPYFRRQQFEGCETDEALVVEVTKLLGDGHDAIFIHHCLAGTSAVFGLMTDIMHEAVFPQEDLLKRAKSVWGGHIHERQDLGNVHVIGSAMNMSVGEDGVKRVVILDTKTQEWESKELPGRKLMKLVNPTPDQLAAIRGYNGLVKIVSDGPIEVPEGMAEKVITLEMPKSDRKKVEMTDDFSPENLLKIYSEARDVPLDRLLAGWRLLSE